MPKPQKLAVRVLGAGLAGPEAAWQCARRGIEVTLYEMRPVRNTPAHETDQFAELVCSNSLKSDSENSAPWLLKQEMRAAGSLLMQMAAETAVPAGHALAVDRLEFSRRVTEAIEREPRIKVVREEVTSLEGFDGITVLATGPLTSDALAAEIQRLSGSDRLYFYDSISPIVEADSIDESKVYRAARYDKGSADYINCPMTREEYEAFLAALTEAQLVDGHDWDNANYFEGCLPIEEIARRGPDTLRFGPMKPVGLRNPRTGQLPYAVVQLRQENLRADSYNLVGFQNHLKFGEQAKVLRLIPGLENAKFVRYGQIHRNTYINAPTLLTPTLQMKQQPRILFAGQLSGVEGYVEAIATGLLAGVAAAALAAEDEPVAVPRATAHGSLVNFLCHSEAKNFQPANITFDLLEQLDEATKRRVRDKKVRHQMVCERALAAFVEWHNQIKPENAE
ncbi:MAG: methylenetetrahydrofolate--tRNA-(uracil(54)-C(5))-methyltransferase (FADH(2)-oxidizing) TrmFO [Acidobacteriota bacterium]|nr:methylenetetrahydrofolate--tRNA-(uracil(54)-C(5))-methyltransferase (FADH(2)-oxidizing) TrmFO [Acidobacteriota bacterium]